MSAEIQGGVTEAGVLIGEAALTAGNLKHNHIYLRHFFHLFPRDAVGGSNSSCAAAKQLRVRWGDGDRTVDTDLDGEKKIFRSRTLVRLLLEHSRARPGDVVGVWRTGPNSYELRLRR